MNSFLNNKECFIHLRSHSSYSRSIGAIQITTLISLPFSMNLKKKSMKLGKSYNMVNSYVQNRRQPSIECLFEIAEIYSGRSKYGGTILIEGCHFCLIIHLQTSSFTVAVVGPEY